MPDDITDTFFAWADRRGLKRSEIADLLKVEQRSVSTYRGSGLPKIKRPLAERLMAEDGPTAGLQQISDEEVSALEKQNLVLKPSDEQFDAWTAAFKHSPAANFHEWAMRALDEIAKFSPKIVQYEPIHSDHKHWVDRRGGVAAGSQISSDVLSEPMPVDKDYGADCYALTVFGQSMEPKIPDGSTIIVQEWKEGFPAKGKIVVYSDGAGSTLKEFGYRKARADEESNNFGQVPVLRSLNKAFPDVQTMESGRIDAVMVEVL